MANDLNNTGGWNIMPKEGWVVINQDVCPLCGLEMKLPSEEDVSWTVDPVKAKFTGAMAVPVCCNKVWLTWRQNDPVWRYEIKDNIYWKYRGQHESGRLQQIVEQYTEKIIRSLQGKPETGDMLQGDSRERHAFLPEAIRAQMQSVESTDG